jgi:hypothetical protein
MYIPMVVALMLVFPLLAAVLQLSGEHGALTAATIIPIIAKWYVFWAVGVRLSSAGIRQIAQPRYTAEKILGIKGEDAQLLVRELGFANVAIGCVGLASLGAPSWVLPVAAAAAIFYGLAGINHLLHGHSNKLQTVAMVSDLFAAMVLAVCVVAPII